jgi:hypothetical protein
MKRKHAKDLFIMRRSAFWRKWLLLVLMLGLIGGVLPGAVAQATVTGVSSDTGLSAMTGPVTGIASKNKDKSDDKDNGNHNGQKKDKTNGKDNGKDKTNGKDNGKHKGKDKGKQQPIDASDPYTVDVTCLFDAAADQSTCTFTGIAPESGKKINLLSLPEAAVCADVVGGTADHVQVDPKTSVTGYQSHGAAASFTLILAGKVSASGTTTYWFKVGGNIFPGQGAGLACAAALEESPESPTPDASTPAADNPSTGKLVVTTYQCAQVPADPQTFDWFGSCEQGGAYHFALDEAGAGAASHYVVNTPADGITEFGELAPGLYHLELSGEKWCHAESDAVNSEGNLNITAGENTQVWIFVCGTAGS